MGVYSQSWLISRKLVLEVTQYDILNGVLCHENPNKPENSGSERHEIQPAGGTPWREVFGSLRMEEAM